jgi:DNA-binding CsgD family transcriptional regulator
MLTLHGGAVRARLSIVPLPAWAGEASPSATLLVLAKHQVCGALAVQGYSRAHKLSPGEEQVLAGLCDGLSPAELAEDHGVAISTVRSQIANIRAKTRTGNIRDLIQQVAVLPPLVGALRGSAEPRRGAATRRNHDAASALGVSA